MLHGLGDLLLLFHRIPACSVRHHDEAVLVWPTPLQPLKHRSNMLGIWMMSWDFGDTDTLLALLPQPCE